MLALLGLAVSAGIAFSSGPPPRLPAPGLPAPPVATGRSTVHHALATLPVSFEPSGNQGFVSRGPGYSLALSPAEAIVAVDGGSFELRPAGPAANPAPVLAPGQPLIGTANHLVGDDPASWTTGVPTYGAVVAQQVWPGVDMRWHGDQRALEHDVVVSPGSDPGDVALEVKSAGPLRLDTGGDLLVDLGATTARLSKPVVYQDVAGTHRTVAGAFAMLGPTRIGFSIGAYDHAAPLVIDPTLLTSTTLGGSGSDLGYGIAVDAAGNSYVTGSTESPDFPTVGPFQATLAPAAGGPSTDVFVSKISSDGSSLLWSTYLGGKGRDVGYAIALGPNGSVYVAGVTESPDFPTLHAAQATFGGGPSDAFVARLAANGSTLDWSTFLGGNQTDEARGLAVDAAGNAYVTGSTSSVNFPTVNPAQTGTPRADDVDAFVTKIAANGASLVYSTRLGGSNDDHGLAIAVDSQGSAYVTGDTLSPGFPTVRPLQAASGGSASGVAGSFPDAFVTKLNPAGNAFVYSTFLGGSDFDQGSAIAVDGTGAAYVAGTTSSANFPTVAALQPHKGGDADAFVAKIAPGGNALVYSTFLGGDGADGANGIAVDPAGDVYVTGTTGSTNWPTAKPTQATKSGGDDAFVAKLNSTGSALLFSTYLGGRGNDSGIGIAADARGVVHVAGLTTSSDFPQVKPLQPAHPSAGDDAFVASISLSDATGAAPSASALAGAVDNSHARRVRALEALTFGLLLIAALQTVYLRRREARTGPLPQPAGRAPGRAGAGLKVLDDAGIGAVPLKGPGSTAAKAGAGAAKRATSKAGGASKSTRTPKTRGGPKPGSGPSKPGSKPGVGPRPQVRPEQSTDSRAADETRSGFSGPRAGAGDEPTMATPAVGAAKPRPKVPAVAQLLEEDMWGPDFEHVTATPDESEVPAGRSARPAQPTVAPAAPPPPMPAPAIAPVPAAELSFWDLFPEDFPLAPLVSFPADEPLGDALALPDGPDSVAGRHVPGVAPSQLPVELARPVDPRRTPGDARVGDRSAPPASGPGRS